MDCTRLGYLGAVLTLAICIALSCQADPVPQPLADSFPLGVYWPWERVGGLAEQSGMDKWQYVDACLDDMKAHHVDSVWVVNLSIADLPELTARVGARQMTIVPALAALHYNVPWRRGNWEYLQAQAKQAIEAVGDSSAVLAWALCDEPRKTFVGEMEVYRRKFASWGAGQPGIVVTMWHDTPTYAQQTDFPVVCPDIYPFFARGNPNGPNSPGASRSWYRRHAATAAKLAYDNGQTSWIMPQAYSEVWGPWRYDETGDVVIVPGGILHWRPPTVGEMRWQVWSALAAGVRGFYWFCYAPHPADRAKAEPYEGKTFPPELAVKEDTPLGFSGALIRPDGTATTQYEAAAEAFGVLRPLIPRLVGAVPADTPLGEVEAPGWLGTLSTPGGQLGVLVNDDTDNEREIKVWLVKPQDVMDLRTRQVLPRAADNTVAVTLAAGDGTVLAPVQ